jgi:hypothetical protein
MPYKDLRPYMRAWIKREMAPRIDRYCKKMGVKKVDFYTEAVDKYLKDHNL